MSTNRRNQVSVRRRTAIIGAAFVLLAGIAIGGAWGANPFVDVAGDTHAADIDAIYNAGITNGCDPTHYCPGTAVNRAQMASFLARAAGLSTANIKHFPVTNARGQTQTYCALAAANPGAYKTAPCQAARTVVDSTGQVGVTSSIAIGLDGFPIISYFDVDNLDLNVVKCFTPTCVGTSTISSLDAASNAGGDSSIAIGADGFPIISYLDTTDGPTNGNLKVAHCITAACTGTPDITTLDSTGNVGLSTSITIGGDGKAVISYVDLTNNSLKLVHCATVACTGAPSPIVLDGPGTVGLGTSIATGADGFPVISYYRSSSGDLAFVKCNNATCTAPNQSTLDSAGNVGQFSSIAVGSDGFPIVSYYDVTNEDLKVLHCTSATCGGATTTAFTSIFDIGKYSSIAIGTDGLPAISYYDASPGDLKYVHCTDIACSVRTISTVDSTGDVGQYTSLTTGADGLSVISYYDVTNKDLKLGRPPVG